MPRFINFGRIMESRMEDLKGDNIRTTEKNYRDGKVVFPVRERIEERIFVKNQTEEHEEYLKFSDELKRDKTMLDPAWRIEIRNRDDGYYVIKSYSRLVREQKV